MLPCVANLVRRALLARHERALHADRLARWQVHEDGGADSRLPLLEDPQR